MPSCKEVAKTVSSGEIETAGLWRRLAIRFHLWICDPCRIYVRQMHQLGDAARRALGSAGEPDERLEKLETRLVERCGESGAGSNDANGPRA